MVSLFSTGLSISFILVMSCCRVSSDTSCRDMAGKAVDWFIIYKMRESYSFFYMDVKTPSWVKGDSLKNDNQAVGFTLNQIYKQTQDDLLYVMYNDEHPDGKTTSSYGHTKGVLASDKQTGFWLVHSVPHFPNTRNQSYDFPEKGRRYGQSFLCLSLSFSQIDTVGGLYLYNHPSVYDFSIPSAFESDVPHLSAVTRGKHVTSPPWHMTQSLQSLAGQEFTAFAKYTKFYADLYLDWLAPYYQSDLHVETWQLGTGTLPSNCSQAYHVYNVVELDVSGYKFKDTQDHSKWAVTADTNKGVTCIGDINREKAQFHRGGGTVCMQIPQVYKLFTQAITKCQPC